MYTYIETDGVGAVYYDDGECIVEANPNRKEEGNEWLKGIIKVINESIIFINDKPNNGTSDI